MKFLTGDVMSREWISKQDVLDGIKILMSNGKKLPYAERIKEIADSFPEGTDAATIRKACIEEQRRQVQQLAEVWLDILVPKPELRAGVPVMDRERWLLAVKQSLRIKDYHKVLDMSIVGQGIDEADGIIKKAREAAAYEAQQKANAEWRSFGDKFEEDDHYRNRILAHWTSARLRKGIYNFDFPSVVGDKPPDVLQANKKMLIREAKLMFPGIKEDDVVKNLMLIGMQHVNEQHCNNCTGWEKCYMNGHKLGLDFAKGRFFVTSAARVCQKYVAAKEAAKQQESAQQAKIQEYLKELGA